MVIHKRSPALWSPDTQQRGRVGVGVGVRGLDPAPGLRRGVGRERRHFVLLLAITHLCPPQHYFLLHPFKSGVSKNMTSYSDRYSSEDGKEGELNHPAGLIEGIWDALGVRHSSSSFFHWRLYKQVSNAPDLVWQTFSKERLKGGWESDTPICFFSFFKQQNQVSTYSSAFPLLPSLSLASSLCFILWQVSCGPSHCRRNGGKSGKSGTLKRALSRIQRVNAA